MIEIKTASTSHLKSLHGLFEQYRAFYQMPRAEKQSLDFLTQRLQKQDSIILLAFSQQQPAGFVQIYPSFSSVAMKPLWILNDLYVSQNSRGIGVASALMKAVEIQAKQQGIFTIKLATAVDNLAAKSLYKSLNYQPLQQFNFFSKQL